MDYQQIVSNVDSLAIALGVIFPMLLSKYGMLGHKIGAGCFLIVIALKGFGLQYAYSGADVVMIILAGVILFLLGLHIGRDRGRKEKVQQND